MAVSLCPTMTVALRCAVAGVTSTTGRNMHSPCLIGLFFDMFLSSIFSCSGLCSHNSYAERYVTDVDTEAVPASWGLACPRR